MLDNITSAASNTSGLIVHSYGRQFIVEYHNNNYAAVTKSKNTNYVVGDRVDVTIINNEQLQIIQLETRKNLIYRMELHKSKKIASNIDQLLIVLAVQPHCDLHLLNRALLVAESLSIQPLIILNKSDLPESQELYNKLYALYQQTLGYTVIQLEAKDSGECIASYLKDKNNLLLGQSGVGKSTIINYLIPDTNTRTGVINKFGTSGNHTTTNASLYHLNATTNIIDCPGLKEFGLAYLQIDQLIYYFPELHSCINQCKFRNCKHINEPQCTVISHYKSGGMDHLRFNLLQNLTQELLHNQKY